MSPVPDLYVVLYTNITRVCSFSKNVVITIFKMPRLNNKGRARLLLERGLSESHLARRFNRDKTDKFVLYSGYMQQGACPTGPGSVFLLLLLSGRTSSSVNVIAEEPPVIISTDTFKRGRFLAGGYTVLGEVFIERYRREHRQ